MNGNIIELKLWRSEWVKTVYDWYESGDYSVFFRNIPHPVYLDNFNYPQITGNLIFGIFAPQQDGLVGLTTVYEYDPNARVCSIGVMIKKDSQNMHLGMDAILTTAKYAFETKGMRKVCFEYVSSDEKITHIFHFMGKFLQPSLALDSEPETSPFFEGRRKKQGFINGKFHDIIMMGAFKDQYTEVIRNYYG